MTRAIKKFISFVTAVALATVVFAVFSACGGENPATPEPDNRTEIVIGSDEYTPYFYVGENGEFSGVDVEIATEAFSRMGYIAEFRMIDWTEKDLLLAAGDVDCLWGSFTMTGREDRYDWAGPYLTSRQVIVVPENSNITKLSDLEGKSLACQATGKVDEIFSVADGTGGIPVLSRLYCFEAFDLAFAALRKDYVDAVAGHETALVDFMNELTGEYRVLDEPIAEVELGVAFGNGDKRGIREKLITTLDEMAKDGTTVAIVERYGISADRVITK